MALTSDDVRNIARLARVALSDEEVGRLREELSGILEQFTILDEIDTEDVRPTAQTFGMTNVERDDVTAPSHDREQVLANAPRREDGYFRVRAVLE